ncbi:hypothetical protein N9A28_01385 [Sulfurimonas sp.]|nr:hypothetical protein [Sulfurimonas sp.]
MLEDKQHSMFLACSNHDTASEGLNNVYEKKLNSVKFGIELKESDEDRIIYTAINKDETLLFTLNQTKNGKQTGYLKDINTMQTIKTMRNLPKVELMSFNWSDQVVNRVIFGSDDDSLLLYTGGNIELYSIKQDKVIRRFHTGEYLKNINYMEVSPDGNYLVGKGSWMTSNARLWDYKTAKKLKDITLLSDEDPLFDIYYITKVHFTNDSKLILLNSTNISIVDPVTLIQKQIVSGLEDMIDAQQIDDKNILIVTSYFNPFNPVSNGSKVITWNIDKKNVDNTVLFTDRLFQDYYIDFSKKRTFGISEIVPAGSKNINVVDMKTGEFVYRLGTKGMATMILPSPKGRFLTVYTYTESTSFFDLSFLDIAYKEY